LRSPRRSNFRPRLFHPWDQPPAVRHRSSSLHRGAYERSTFSTAMGIRDGKLGVSPRRLDAENRACEVAPDGSRRGRCRTAGWRQAAHTGCVPWSTYPSVGRCGIRLPPVSGGAIRSNRCGRGAPRPTARASAPPPDRPSIGPRGHTRPHAGRRPPSDSGRRFR
jgi:hypothetical protein